MKFVAQISTLNIKQYLRYTRNFRLIDDQTAEVYGNLESLLLQAESIV